MIAANLVLLFAVFQAKAALIDDALAAINNLRQSVKGDILAAEDNIERLNSSFLIYSTNIEVNTGVTIQNEKDIIDQTVLNLKDLAHAALVDISSCLGDREDYLNALPEQIYHELTHCITVETTMSDEVFSAAKYIVDVYINRVEALNFQLMMCGTFNDVCIAPIYQQIGQEQVQIPADIKVEVSKTEDLVDELKVNVQECSEAKLAQYSSAANRIVQDIVQCVDTLLG